MDNIEKIMLITFVIIAIVLIIVIRSKSETEYDRWFEAFRKVAFEQGYSEEDIEYWETFFFFYDEFINEVTPEDLIIKIKKHAY